MSSPFTMPNYGYSDRAGASSPSLPPRGEGPQVSEDVSIRPMRLKVLYSFDDQNKTNCLARWPQILDIRTAYIDESTQIGVIELKTCIQAIVSASPELVAKLGQDYTVYAYDYSEYETPLVGQGMLSWVLASSSSTPSAPAHLSRTVVTGRVCKNILGLFSSTSQETLEVKLKLVPVPTCLQSEYMESMRKYRDLSKIMPEGFDSGAWISFLQANPAIVQLASQSRCQSPATIPVQKEIVGHENAQRLASVGSSGRISGDQCSYSMTESAGQLHRPTSPATSVQSAAAPSKRRGRPPRTASQNSNRGRDTQPKALACRDSIDTYEEGPTKKRAKVSKADWTGSMGFSKQPESLRVAASTAASVRIHQPTAVRPMANNTSSLEGAPRAPTPIADPINHLRRPTLPTARSNLRRESYTAESVAYESPYSGSVPKPPESLMTSPEDSRVGSLSNTPPDIGSSPPIYRRVSTAPSSPNLPTLPGHVDSGFMSGSIDHLFEDDELRPLDDEDLDVAAQYTRRSDLLVAAPEKEDVHQPDLEYSPVAQQSRSDAKAVARSRQAARNASGPRALERKNSLGGLAALVANSDPTPLIGSYQSQTWPSVSEIGTSPQMPESAEMSKERNRSGSGAGAKRKKAIQNKLATSIAAGEMPPFCENCGAIETPTWRKAWVKVHSGTPEHVRISDEEGGIVAWETLQTDAEGTVTLYRIIKRSLLPGEEETFTDILLCNPCGLWLHTRKCIRPKEVWEKSQRDPSEKRKRGPRAKKQKPEPTSQQAGSDCSQGANQQSGASSPANEAGAGNEVEEVPQLPQYNRPRASSLQLTSGTNPNKPNNSAAMALQRAIQSSPARFMGTEHVPIEVEDLTPKPTRRVLFPSPVHIKDQVPMGESSSNVSKSSKKTSARADDGSIEEDYDQADKENCPPPLEAEETYNRIFEESGNSTSRPTTPTPSNKISQQLFKTPGKPVTPDRQPPTTGDFFSSAAKRLLLPTTPKHTPSKTLNAQPLGEITPFTAHLNQLLSEANDASPSRGSIFDFPSLPSLNNTPGGGTRHDFDFSTFDPQDLLSTDVPVPSSPPAWFGVYEDPIEQETGLWSDYQFPGLQNDTGGVTAEAGLEGSTPNERQPLIQENAG